MSALQCLLSVSLVLWGTFLHVVRWKQHLLSGSLPSPPATPVSQMVFQMQQRNFLQKWFLHDPAICRGQIGSANVWYDFKQFVYVMLCLNTRVRSIHSDIA